MEQLLGVKPFALWSKRERRGKGNERDHTSACLEKLRHAHVRRLRLFFGTLLVAWSYFFIGNQLVIYKWIFHTDP